MATLKKTREELIKAVKIRYEAAYNDGTDSKARFIISTFEQLIVNALVDGYEVRTGMGIYKVIETKATTVKHPKTGVIIAVPAKRRLRLSVVNKKIKAVIS